MPTEKATAKGKHPKAGRPYMPGYGLPKGTKGLLPWKWAEDRLRKSHNYWIVTVRSDRRPHLMIVWGLWLDGVFYFSTGRHSRKAHNIAQNSHCVISTDQAHQAVIVEGTAEEVPDVSLRRDFLTKCERKYDYDLSSFEADVLSRKEPIYAVFPSVVFGLDEKKSLNRATRWKFPK